MKEALFDPLEDVENLEYKPEEERNQIAMENYKKFYEENIPNFSEVDVEKDGIDENYIATTLKLTDEINDDI